MGYVLRLLDESLTEVGTIGRVRSASIQRDCKSRPTTLESLDVSIDVMPSALDGVWVRLDRTGDGSRHLGVFRLAPDSVDVKRGVATVKALGASVLTPANEEALEPGHTIWRRTDAPSYAARMLSSCPGRVTWSGTAMVPENVVMKDGDTKLAAAWAALDAVGWCMRLDGVGNVELMPLPDESAASVTERTAGILPGIGLGDSVSYSRSSDLGTDLFDVVDVSIPSAGVDGSMRVVSQDIECGASIICKEVIE